MACGSKSHRLLASSPGHSLIQENLLLLVMGTGGPQSSPCGASQAPRVQERESSPSFALLSGQQLRTAAKRHRSRTGVFVSCVAGQGLSGSETVGVLQGCPVTLPPLCSLAHVHPPASCSQQPAQPLGVTIMVAVVLGLNFRIPPPEQLIFYCFS